MAPLSASGSEGVSDSIVVRGRQPVRPTRASVRLRLLPPRHQAAAMEDDDAQSDYQQASQQLLREDASDEMDSSADMSSAAIGTRLRKRKRVQSSLGPSLRKRASGKQRRSSSSSRDGSQREGTRRSGRNGRPTKSMRERGEDDIWARDEVDTPPNGPRAAGAKETFKELPEDKFRMKHRQSCDSCGEWGDSEFKGPLVFCQGCVLAYHKSCLGHRNVREHLVTKIAEEDFVLQCRRCIKVPKKKEATAPSLDMCQGCEETGPACAPFRERRTAKQEEKEREDNDGEDPIVPVDPKLLNNAKNIFFRCIGCNRAFHFEHLPSRSVEDEMEKDANTAELRYKQYSSDWSCLDCTSAPGKVQALVAWRPNDVTTHVPDSPVDIVDEDDKEYLVKWEKRSYLQATWMPGAWVWGVTTPAMRKAFAKRDNGYNLPKMTEQEAIPEEFTRIDIVLDVEYSTVTDGHSEEEDKDRVHEVETALVKYKGLGYDEVVWEQPPTPDDGEAWEDFVVAYNDWVLGRYIHLPKRDVLKERIKTVKSKNFKRQLLKGEQPDYLIGGKLMEYQLEGLNWLLYKWYKGQNAILADEMGLGKTIQVIGFLSTLVNDHSCWPFLVVVPNSTCLNWRREIKRWAPNVRAVAYFGSAEARNIAMEYELCPKGKRDLVCHVVITSYEAPTDENSRRFFRQTPWAGLIVDEGQRLKNDKNQLYGALNSLRSPFKLLLTGTPLQNNVRELFNLLQFLNRDFDAAGLEEEYAVLDKSSVARLHDTIRPFFLRRTKAQVLTFLPPMAQIIVPVSMSVLQKKLYKSILAKNPELIKAIFGRGDQTLKRTERSNLNNILMQLRKCLCHPFVYSKLIEERNVDPATAHRTLVDASSKLQLLDLMLPALKERGHRVLIFSQFLEMLDLVEDFLEDLGLPFERLDGSTTSLQKQKKIDAYNAPDSPLFAFLLSTRAGGVGINLATADTVIIMDPDFNPHQDIQALSRAHRIGQQKKVLVFQLMTRGSAEEKIIQIGRKKMALDHILIEKMDADDDEELDLQSILKHGAAALFDDNTEREIHYDAASVEKLLDRTQAESTKTGDDNSAESQFSFARVWANDQAELQDGLKDSEGEQTPPDPSIWDKLLGEREREAAQRRADAQQAFGRGKRKRQAVNYAREAADEKYLLTSSPMRQLRPSESDTDFHAGGADDGEETEDEFLSPGQVEPDELASKKERAIRGIADPDHAKGAAALSAMQFLGPGIVTSTDASDVSIASHIQSFSYTAGRAVSGLIDPSSELRSGTLASTTYPAGGIAGGLGHSFNSPSVESSLISSDVDSPQAFTQTFGNSSNQAQPPASPHVQPTSSGGTSILPRYHWPLNPPIVSSAPIAPLSASDNNVLNNAGNNVVYRLCPACSKTHQIGFCPLKLGGFERCPLCGLAHFGAGPKCAHMQTEEQVTIIMDAIKQSPEDKEIKEAAIKYLRGVKGKLAVKRRQDAKKLQPATGAATTKITATGGVGGASGTPALAIHRSSNGIAAPGSNVKKGRATAAGLSTSGVTSPGIAWVPVNHTAAIGHVPVAPMGRGQGSIPSMGQAGANIGAGTHAGLSLHDITSPGPSPASAVRVSSKVVRSTGGSTGGSTRGRPRGKGRANATVSGRGRGTANAGITVAIPMPGSTPETSYLIE